MQKLFTIGMRIQRSKQAKVTGNHPSTATKHVLYEGKILCAPKAKKNYIQPLPLHSQISCTQCQRKQQQLGLVFDQESYDEKVKAWQQLAV